MSDDELRIPVAALDRLCTVLTSEARVAVEHMTPSQHLACALEQLKITDQKLETPESRTRRDLALMHLFLSVRRDDVERSTPAPGGDDGAAPASTSGPTFQCPLCAQANVGMGHESLEPAPHVVHRVADAGGGYANVTLIVGNPNFAEARYGRGGTALLKTVILDL